jgi:hypothetical protein
LCLDGNALNQVIDPDGHRPDGHHYHTDPQNPDISSLDRKAKEKHGDAELDEHHVGHI